MCCFLVISLPLDQRLFSIGKPSIKGGKVRMYSEQTDTNNYFLSYTRTTEIQGLYQLKNLSKITFSQIPNGIQLANFSWMCIPYTRPHNRHMQNTQISKSGICFQGAGHLTKVIKHIKISSFLNRKSWLTISKFQELSGVLYLNSLNPLNPMRFSPFHR